MSFHAFVIKLRLKALKRRCDRLSDYIGTYCSVVIENMLKTDDFASKVEVSVNSKNSDNGNENGR